MTIETITLQANQIHGMAIAAAKKDVRYYLLGVLLECNEGKPARLVATDGHLLACYDTDHHCETTCSAVLPLDVIKQIPKKGVVTITIEPQGDRPARLTISAGAAVLQAQALDGRFPNYRRIMPGSIPREQIPAGYNPDLLVRLVKCAETVLGIKNLQALPLYQAGERAAITWKGESWTGIVMPMRGEADAAEAAAAASRVIGETVTVEPEAETANAAEAA